jgi:hypothetical protein
MVIGLSLRRRCDPIMTPDALANSASCIGAAAARAAVSQQPAIRDRTLIRSSGDVTEL